MEREKTVEVLLPLKVNSPFTYAACQTVQVGDLVLVPFRKKEQWGVVWEIGNSAYKGPFKQIKEKADLPPLSLSFLHFIQKVASYNYFPLGLGLKLALSQKIFEKKKTKKSFLIPLLKTDFHTPHFSPEQQAAVHYLIQTMKQSSFAPVVLDGITGSGKTEVYLEAISHALQSQKQVLVLLPEIALTTQMIQRFETRFGIPPFLWHSHISPSIKRDIWQATLQKQPIVIVGARSALFLPFHNLGLIIVDEEHDGSYKQEEQILYHARDMAILKAFIECIPVVLVSATPSLETIRNIEVGKYQKVTLKARHGGATLPSIHSIDMRKHPKGWVSPPLIKAIQETLDKKEQSLLFLNRRGYSPLTLCHQCGFRLLCPLCEMSLVEHRSVKRFCCHYCGYSQFLPPFCPECQTEESFVACGCGVERLHETVTRLFPSARIDVLTSDTLTSLPILQDSLKRIHTRQVDIIIGTQLLAKGHHFPLMTLVGVIDADLSLKGPDLRGGERTYQLLHQVSGRSGRATHQGQVFLQTHNPDHPVIQSLCQQNREEFNKLELSDRQRYNMPPFSQLVSLYLSSRHQTLVAAIAKMLSFHAPQQLTEVKILGPSPAPLSYLKGHYRWRFLLTVQKGYPVSAFLDYWLKKVKIPSTVSLQVDVDPQSFY